MSKKRIMNKIIPAIILIGGTILMIKLVEAKPKPPEELVLPKYPVSRVVFIKDKLTELASEQINIPKQELNWLWT